MEKNKLNLAIVVEATVGGIRKHILDLINNLDPDKFTITLIYSPLRVDEVFLATQSLLKKRNINLIELKMVRNLNPLADLISLVKLRTILKKINPDVIHLHAAKAGTLGRIGAATLGKRNVIYTPHGGSFHKFDERFGFIYKLVEKLLAFKSVHFIAVSKHAQKQYHELLNISGNKNHLIYNGIPAEKPKSGDINRIRKDYNLGAEDLIVLFPALFYEAKGHLQFLNALSEYNGIIDPRIKFLFAGDGPLKTIIEEKTESLKSKINVRMLGFVQDLNPLFLISDIILLPSQNEVFGYVLLEAMLYSKPVFATSADAIPELIKNNINGELFPKDRLVYICDRLNYFVSNKNELTLMGQKGFENLKEKFSLELMVKKTEAVYLSFLLNK